jgi:hypothetical protein
MRAVGWEIVGSLGYEDVRHILIDEAWSALRFHPAGDIRRRPDRTTTVLAGWCVLFAQQVIPIDPVCDPRREFFQIIQRIMEIGEGAVILLTGAGEAREQIAEHR